MDIFGKALIISGIRTPGQKLIALDGTNFKRESASRHVLRTFDRFRAYSFAVWLPMLGSCVQSVLSFTRRPNAHTFIDVALSSIAPVQYLYGIRYFATDHFDAFNSECDLDSSAFDDVVRRPCKCTPNVIAVASSFCALAYFVLSSHDVASPWHALVVDVFRRSYGAFSISLNAFCLTFVFWKHIKAAEVYVRSIQAQTWKACDDYIVSVLLRNLIRMKQSLNASTFLLQNIFSSITAVGGLCTGAVIYSGEDAFDTFVYTSLGCFFLAQVMFFYVIFRLSEAKQSIEIVVRSAEFADSFLHRVQSGNASERTRETSTTVDWLVITYLLKERWIDFSVLGMPLHSGAFLKQCIVAMSAFIMYSDRVG